MMRIANAILLTVSCPAYGDGLGCLPLSGVLERFPAHLRQL